MNKESFVLDPNGSIYWISRDGETIKVDDKNGHLMWPIDMEVGEVRSLNCRVEVKPIFDWDETAGKLAHVTFDSPSKGEEKEEQHLIWNDVLKMINSKESAYLMQYFEVKRRKPLTP